MPRVGFAVKDMDCAVTDLQEIDVGGEWVIRRQEILSFIAQEADQQEFATFYVCVRKDEGILPSSKSTQKV